MSDVKCVVCGEPWDYWGVRHGDMAVWEFDLFRKGSGCPSCEGRVKQGWHPESLEDVEFGDEDPGERLSAYEDCLNGTAPKWERPELKTVWQCDGCGVQAVEDPDYLHYDGTKVVCDGLSYQLPHDAKGQQWFNSHPYGMGRPDREPAATFGEDRVCEFCLSHCEECGAEVSGVLEFGDMYDEGYCVTHPDYFDRVACLNCYEKIDHDEE